MALMPTDKKTKSTKKKTNKNKKTKASLSFTSNDFLQPGARGKMINPGKCNTSNKSPCGK